MSGVVSIDIGEKKIRIIKTNKAGVIRKAGEYALDKPLEPGNSEEYINAVCDGIKSAAKAAGIRKTNNCLLTVGGAHIIARHFLWPEMTPEAMDLNAGTEMALYLPVAPENFNISWRIMRKNPPLEEGAGATAEVLAAAMDKNAAEALTKAARQAGFNPARIDIRENARHKIFHAPSLWISDKKLVTTFGNVIMQPEVFDPEDSFAVLDIADSLMNMTVFIKGIFYANRYFGGLVTDEDSLAAEVVSIIEYMGYREREANIKALFILGDDRLMPRLKESLEESLGIDIYYPQKTVTLGYMGKKHRSARIKMYLDALGATVSAEKGAGDVDLRPKKTGEKTLLQSLKPIAISVFIFAGLMVLGTYLTGHNITRLEGERQRLEGELKRHTISQSDVAFISNEITTMTKTIVEIEEFHGRYPSALTVLRGIYGALPRDAEINGLTINRGSIVVSGTTSSLNIVSDYLVKLRENKLFSEITAETVLSREDEEGSAIAVAFDIKIIIMAAGEGGEAVRPAES